MLKGIALQVYGTPTKAVVRYNSFRLWTTYGIFKGDLQGLSFGAGVPLY
ncbi:hypothetical protein [Scytonema sp. PRP1]